MNLFIQEINLVLDNIFYIVLQLGIPIGYSICNTIRSIKRFITSMALDQ